MTKKIKYILPVIVASIILFSSQLSYAQNSTGTPNQKEGRAISTAPYKSPSPAVLAEIEKQRAEQLKKAGITAGAQGTPSIEGGMNGAQSPATSNGSTTTIWYAIIAGFAWLIVLTVKLFGKSSRSQGE
jgi:hypothetical protein